jgi:hypothetical protein
MGLRAMFLLMLRKVKIPIKSLATLTFPVIQVFFKPQTVIVKIILVKICLFRYLSVKVCYKKQILNIVFTVLFIKQNFALID